MHIQSWSTAELPPQERFGAWRDVLNATHLGWELAGGDSRFDAVVTRRDVGRLSLVECRCDPCLGIRGPHQIDGHDPDCIGILFGISGREVLRRRESEVTLHPGDFVIWDSSWDVEFHVLEPLHKLTVFVPKSVIRRFQPNLERLTGLRVGREGQLGPLINVYLGQLAREVTRLDDASLQAALDALLELISAGIGPTEGASGVADAAFGRVTSYILANLPDPGLAPRKIADANGMSLRYLHKLFAERGLSVSRWIRQQRLDQCRKLLVNRNGGRSVTDIALDWGFNDGAHFSRIFRNEFGMSPRDARKMSLNNTGVTAAHCGDIAG